ncbi:MAG: RHS repeat-associated core domain-containing protein [Verrucomicrobiaceae bacterium]|nr:RHS repeat-associated core domain-containing protein [Verrucomicrobiaceae bacterium]
MDKNPRIMLAKIDHLPRTKLQSMSFAMNAVRIPLYLGRYVWLRLALLLGIASMTLVARADGNARPVSEDWYAYDSNGNVILLTDEAAKPTARYQYDAFGKTLTATGTAAESNTYRFSTKPIETGSGLAFYGFRYYSPELGRWPSRDPIGERGGLNVFVIAGNNAISGADNRGLSCTPTNVVIACQGGGWTVNSIEWKTSPAGTYSLLVEGVTAVVEGNFQRICTPCGCGVTDCVKKTVNIDVTLKASDQFVAFAPGATTTPPGFSSILNGIGAVVGAAAGAGIQLPFFASPTDLSNIVFEVSKQLPENNYSGSWNGGTPPGSCHAGIY